MKYRLLGKSGLRVSEAALGTMTFGEEWGWGSPKEEAQKVYETYREAGGNFIDAANFYTNGTSERFLGDLIQLDRQSVVLATKYSNAAPGNDPNAAGNHRKSMMQAVEASLKRLQTDYIDLYWVHIWDGITPVEEVMRGLDDLVRQGKVLYIGNNVPLYMPSARSCASVIDLCAEQPKTVQFSVQWNNNTPPVFFSSQMTRHGATPSSLSSTKSNDRPENSMLLSMMT